MKKLSLFSIAALLLHAQHSFCADQKPDERVDKFFLYGGIPSLETEYDYIKDGEKEAILKKIQSALDKAGIPTDYRPTSIFTTYNTNYSDDKQIFLPPYLLIKESGEALSVINPTHSLLNPITSVISDYDDYTDTDAIVKGVSTRLGWQRTYESLEFIRNGLKK